MGSKVMTMGTGGLYNEELPSLYHSGLLKGIEDQ
jgi:hypothetical protein